MWSLERAPVEVTDQSHLHITPKVIATGVGITDRSPFEILHELFATCRSGELLVVEAFEVIVSDEAEMTGAVKTLIEALGEATLEALLDETNEVVGELRLFLGGVELGGSEVLSGELLGSGPGCHDVYYPSLCC